MLLGTRVRALRKELNLKQNELAERAGIKPHTLWRIESGKHKTASTRVLQALARELGVTIDALLSDSARQPRTRTVS